MIFWLFIASFLGCLLGLVIGSVLTAAGTSGRLEEYERERRRELIASLEEAVRE